MLTPAHWHASPRREAALRCDSTTGEIRVPLSLFHIDETTGEVDLVLSRIEAEALFENLRAVLSGWAAEPAFCYGPGVRA